MKKLIFFVLLFVLLNPAIFAQITKEWRSVSEFDMVVMNGPFELYIVQDQKYELYIEAEESVMKDIETAVACKTLNIGTLENKRIKSCEPVKIYVHAPEIMKIKMTGSGLVKSVGLKARKLEVELIGTGSIDLDELLVEFLNTQASGSGKVELDVEAEEIQVEITGSGNIQLQGNCRKSQLRLNGTGEINTASLVSDTCKARIIGTGNIFTAANKKIDAEIFGTGNIYYFGDAEITVNSLGTGKIIRQK